MHGITPGPDSGFYFLSQKYFNGLPNEDQVLSRLNKNGNILWTKSFSDSALYAVWNTIIQTTPDNDLLMLGIRRETISSFERFSLCKLNLTGEVIWRHLYSYNNMLAPSSIQLCIVDTSHYLMIAHTYQTSYPSVLIMTDYDGDTLWSLGMDKSYHTFGKVNNDKILGISSNVETYEKLGIIILNKDGSVHLLKSLVVDSSDNRYFIPNQVFTGTDGKIRITGYSNEPGLIKTNRFLLTLDQNYQFLSLNEYIIDDSTIIVEPDININQLLTDSNHVIFSCPAIHYDALGIPQQITVMIKISETGYAYSALKYETPFPFQNKTFNKSQDGGFLIAGQLDDWPSYPGYRCCVLKTGPDGQGLCYTSPIQVNTISYDLKSSTWSQSLTQGCQVFDSYFVTNHHTPWYYSDFCVSNTIPENTAVTAFRIFPNPASDQLTIISEKATKKNQWYSIYDSYGKIVTQGIFIGNETTINLRDFRISSGIFVIRLTDGESAYSSKFIHNR